MCDVRKKPMKKAKVQTPKFLIGQDVELIHRQGEVFKVQAVITSADRTSFQLEKDGVLVDGYSLAADMRHHQPKAFFFMWVDDAGNITQTMYDENGWSPMGQKLYDRALHNRLDFTKTELIRKEPVPVPRPQVEEDEDLDEDEDW